MSSCNCNRTQLGRSLGKAADYLVPMTGIYGQAADNMAKRVKAWTGFGDYQINYNSLMQGDGMMAKTHGPSFIPSSEGRGLTIRWYEYIGDVCTSPGSVGGFNADTYRINPGNPIAFPWLSVIATQFEQYKPKGIFFEFRSTATETTTNASLGSVIFATEYDLYDPDKFVSKHQMLQTAYSNEGKSTSNILHGIECAPNEMQNILYNTRDFYKVSDGATDKYDLCETTVATYGGGLPTGQSIGSLYVHYEFEFLKQQGYANIPRMKNFYTQNLYTTTSYVGASPKLSAYEWANDSQCFTLGITVDDTGNVIKIPPKFAGCTFEITFRFNNGITSFTTAAAANPITDGCSLAFPNLNSYMTSLAYYQAPQAASTGVLNATITWYIKMDEVIPKSWATITWANSAAGFASIGCCPSSTAALSAFSINAVIRSNPSNWS